MPVHDWTQVDANLFHHFHQMWMGSICNALNGGILPRGYCALVEQHAGGLIPDVLAFERRRRPSPPSDPVGGRVVTATPPKTRHSLRATSEILSTRASRIGIHHPLGDVVAVIEIVSPGNKASRLALRAFVEKTIELLSKGIHILVVDLFPPSVRDPQGIHKAIWDEIEDQPFELPQDQRLTLAAYVAAAPLEAHVEPIGVSDMLVDMPAYLDVDYYVMVPLEATYQATWATCPIELREAVETPESRAGD